MIRNTKTWYVAVGCLLLSCGQGSGVLEEKHMPPDTTATALPAAAPDTVLQPTAALTIRALGNTTREVRFDQDTLQVPAGARVTLNLVNEATDMPIYHNLVITKPHTAEAVARAGAKIGSPGNYVPDDPAVLAASPLALPGQTVTLEFIAPKEPGTYEFICTYPDHWQRMQGVFLVK